MKEKIQRLLKASKEVINNCSLPNGAIVAANTDLINYPPNAVSYRFVWPRDASYTCVAANLLGLNKIPERFFYWILDHAENFKTTKKLYNVYNTNGTIHGTCLPKKFYNISSKTAKNYFYINAFGTHFQADQYGALLWAIDHHIKTTKRKPKRLLILIRLLTEGLCNSWNNDHFKYPCFDLWEEIVTNPKKKQVHISSLAMAILGLECSMNYFSSAKTKRILKQMKERLNELIINKVPQIIKKNKKIDSSMLSLVWPTNLLTPNDKLFQCIINHIIKNNTNSQGGLLRYPGDKYSGMIKHGIHQLNGAGAWPILNFWISICLASVDKKKANNYHKWVVNKVNKYIPEQIFVEKNKKSISPLCWSHSMFVIASKKLGYF